jgi:uncharacterized protein (DUF302 family)
MDRLILMLAVLAFAAISASGEGVPAPIVTSTAVKHVHYKSSKPFEAVTKSIEAQAGKFDGAAFASLMTSSLKPAEIESKLRAMEGSSGFMLFAVRDHGQLLALKGKQASALQYEIGNPLFAVEMTNADIRAGEYAPLRMYVYVGEDHLTHVDYDLPSSVFGRFHSSEVDKVAHDLDRKLETLVTNALR